MKETLIVHFTHPPSLTHLQVHLRQIISNLYMLIVQAHDYQGAGTQKALTDEMCVSPRSTCDM